MDELERLDAEEKDLQEKLNKVRAKQRAEKSGYPTLEDFATFLHEKLCHWDHTDGCSWFYEQGWSGTVHQQYLAKAKAIKAVEDKHNIPREATLKIIRLTKR